MQTKLSFALSLVFFGSLICNDRQVEANENDLLSAVHVQQAGMTRDWFTLVGVDDTRSRLVDLKLVVNSEEKTTIHDLTYGRHHEHYTVDDLGPDGQAIGPDRLKEFLEVRKSIIEEKYGDSVEVKISTYDIQDSTLFALTNQSIVQAIDANTGETLWSARIGKLGAPTIGLGANKQYVAVVVGSHVYCLDAKTGEELWSKQCRHAPGASPAVSEKYVYVPMFNGFVEAFPFETNGIRSHYFVSAGRAMMKPIVHTNTVAWPTDRGHLNVAPNFRAGSMFFRLKTDSEIVGHATAFADMIYVGAIDGTAYGVNETSGSLQWKLAMGEPISHPIVPIGKDAYIITDEHHMTRIHSQLGYPVDSWPVRIPHVKSFLAASNERLYCLDETNDIVIINQEDGAKVSAIPALGNDFHLMNLQTDRIYIGTSTGLIQCIREVANERVIYHADKLEQIVQQKTGDEQETDPQKGNDEGDPFGTKDEGDPFGGGGAKKDDPFSGGGAKKDDPFSTGGEKKSDSSGDPDDPFSTGGSNKQGGEQKKGGDPFGG